MIHVTDLFCGAGGTSTGLVEAAHERGLKVQLTAVNHWPRAIETHTANHPEARHLCKAIDQIDPRELYKPGQLSILWASPECIFFSIARGGKPVCDQRRSTAWDVLRWAETLLPPVILLENVKEFEQWGPLGANGKPLKSRRGETFLGFVRMLESLGYRVEWRVLCAADYGDPTTRRRLFIFAVRGRRKIVWPEPTHTARNTPDLFSTRKPWVPAREIVDWSDPGKSIYRRKRPLAEKTMRRILLGLEQFGLAPFIVPQQQGGHPVKNVGEPLPTVTTTSRGVGLAQPYLIHLRGTSTVQNIDKPAPALTAGGGHLGLCQPYLVEVAHGNTEGSKDDKRRSKAVSDPLGTVPCSNRFGVCQPFIIGIDHQGGTDHIRDVDEPLSTTTTTKARHAICQPYLIKFYGTGQASSIEEPVDTVTTKERFGVCVPTIQAEPGDYPPEVLNRMPKVEINGQRYRVDILFRMLKWSELALAQGFPRDYRFTGTSTEIVKQIGNAVPKNLAKALGSAALSIL